MSQQFWNDRYEQHTLAYGNESNRFLVEATSRYLEPGKRVLLAGEGEGRNAIWLAEKGLEVWAIDYAVVGLKKAKRQAEMRGHKINFLCADVTTWKWPLEFFDALVIIFLHLSPEWRQSVHRSMIRSLKPDGLILLQCFHVDQLNYDSGGPRRVDHLYTLEMLQDDFRGMNFLQAEETEVELREGIFHDGPAAVVSTVIQKV